MQDIKGSNAIHFVNPKFYLQLFNIKTYHNTHIRFILGGVSCPAGSSGNGGNCQCDNATGWNEGQWKSPWCYDGACYTGQSHDECKDKKNGHPLGDGTWCWNKERNTQCPASGGVTCPAGGRGSGGECQCEKAIGGTEGQWRTPWCYDGVCYTGQAYDGCKDKKNGHPLGDGTWCWNQERNTRCPTTSGRIV